jgi:dTDP-4-amino-4,6-dideoxygalactose transaminase
MPALRVAVPDSDFYNSYYKYYVYVRPEKLSAGWSRERILHALGKKGIACGCGACPEVYMEKAFRDYYRKIGKPRQKRLPIAKYLGETSIMFQVHPTLCEEDMHHIIDEMGTILKRATG